MSIQNIDFAKKLEITKKYEINENKKKIPQSRVFFLIFLAGFFLGSVFGYKLHHLQYAEATLIKNPDVYEEQSPAGGTVRNPSITVPDPPSLSSDIILYLGTFDAKLSSEIIRFLQSRNIIEEARFVSCHHLKNEKILRQGSLFRIPYRDGKQQKLVIGCFPSIEEATVFLNKIKAVYPQLFTQAEVLQLEE